jgi:signal transduction histidine kinase
MHGGTLRIESAPNKGTQVFVTFPPERTMPAD